MGDYPRRNVRYDVQRKLIRELKIAQHRAISFGEPVPMSYSYATSKAEHSIEERNGMWYMHTRGYSGEEFYSEKYAF